MSDARGANQLIAPDVKLGRDVRIFGFVNLYGCEIGDETRIGSFVEIQKNARISPPMQLLPETPPACLRIVFPLPMKVPFLDLKAHHAPLRGHFKTAIAEVIDSGIFAGGPAVADFEEAFAAFCKCDYAVGLG